MKSAKELRVRPIGASEANKVVKRLHYSGKVVQNSQVHFGVFWGGRLEGVMQFGPSLNKKGTIKLVSDTSWSGYIELNRMAFSERLPRNSESRAIAIAMRLLRKHYPHLEWVVSFSDGCQCGDGTIYRASGFVLTDIRASDKLRINPETGDVMHAIAAHHKKQRSEFYNWKALDGFQMRYIYFLNPSARERLTVPVLPFSKIDEMGAGMYRGKARDKQAMAGDQSEQRRGSTDRHAPNEGADNGAQT